MDNKGFRITIDGQTATGKTFLLAAFAEFLKVSGFENVTALCDSNLEEVLKNGSAMGRLSNQIQSGKPFDKTTPIVLVERNVSRTRTWDPMPNLENQPGGPTQPFFKLDDDEAIHFEMHNRMRGEASED